MGSSPWSSSSGAPTLRPPSSIPGPEFQDTIVRLLHRDLERGERGSKTGNRQKSNSPVVVLSRLPLTLPPSLTPLGEKIVREGLGGGPWIEMWRNFMWTPLLGMK